MNICLINKETHNCENIAVFEDMQTAVNLLGDRYDVIEQVEEYGIGDIHKDGVWRDAQISLEPKEVTQEEDSLSMLIDQEYRMTMLELGIPMKGEEDLYALQNNKKNDRKGFGRWFGRKN